MVVHGARTYIQSVISKLRTDMCKFSSGASVCLQILTDFYLFRHRRLSKRSIEPGHSNLTGEPEVWHFLLIVISMRKSNSKPLERVDITSIVRFLYRKLFVGAGALVRTAVGEKTNQKIRQ